MDFLEDRNDIELNDFKGNYLIKSLFVTTLNGKTSDLCTVLILLLFTESLRELKVKWMKFLISI